MAEVQTGEFVKYRSNLIDALASMKVWLWDMGPEKPVAPKRPNVPKGKEGDPEYDLAVLEFKEQLELYEDALKRYRNQKVEFAAFNTQMGGPVEVLMWSCDAADALRRDAKAIDEGRQTRPRWCISARTRGYQKLPNGGLPEGVKPGHGHQANIERQIAGDKEFLAALKADPVFGQEMHA